MAERAEAVIAFPDSQALAGEVAKALDLPLMLVGLHRFPDGESLVQLEGAPGTAILLRSLDRPNDKLVELLLLTTALRERGTRHLTLVAPYLPYMRQDMEFRPGEVVSQRVIGTWLAGLVDALVTVDPHLHRTDDLAKVFPGKPSVVLSAGPLLGAWARAQGGGEGWVVLGPDEESAPLARGVAAAAGASQLVAGKERRGDRDVVVTLPPGTDLGGRTVLVVDDVCSSGGTLIDCARAAQGAGAERVLAAVTHALFGEEALDRMRAAGIEAVVSADGVPHPTNKAALAPLVTEALVRLGG